MKVKSEKYYQVEVSYPNEWQVYRSKIAGKILAKNIMHAAKKKMPTLYFRLALVRITTTKEILP